MARSAGVAALKRCQRKSRIRLDPASKTQTQFQFSLLRFAEADGAVAGVDNDGLATAIHFAVELRGAKGALDGEGNPHGDVAVVRAGFDVGLKFAWERDVNAAVTGADAPAGIDLGAWADSRVNAAVASFDVQAVEAAFQGDVAVA